ncbi:uncharacterized protein [Rutidosis leptorrhynchoides]|uniref:uncharacterized protein n=1 Tax=Rutidosis leptorrhynchoides TaxID=125765 RepID=UPI003A9A3BFD
MAPERSKFIRDEVRSLVDAGILREVKYQTWVANPVMDQIGRNLEAYVDDIVIKSHTEEKKLRDIQETFASLRKINMKLNPKKCMLGVEEEKFLGHIVTERGIKANPKKIQAIEDMKSSASKKDVQRLHGCLAALTRFLSKAAEKSLPFMKEGETMILYLAVSKEAVSSVLIAERNGVQMPIYFVSKILQLSETNYPLIHRMVYALVHTARRLRRNAVKGQILEDFLLETNEKVEYDNKMAPQQHVWELHTDGASSEEGTGAGLVLTSPDGEEYTYALKFCFYASNNEAEYEALLSGLPQQVNRMFDARDTSMRQYVKLVEAISKKIDNLEVVQIPRNKNKKADILSKLATLTFDHLRKRVLVEELKEKSILEKPIMAIVEGAKETWMTPYLRYLHDGGLPIDKAEARRIRVTAPMYEVVNGDLYRKSYNGPLLRCLTNDEALKVVKEMHEGRHGTVQHLPKYDLIPVSWPFCKWAIDIVGPFNRSTANGQVEVTNKEIVAGIKARLGLSQTGWVDELPNVLWAHRTTPSGARAKHPSV